MVFVSNVGPTVYVLHAKITIFEIAWIHHVPNAPETGSLLLALLKYYAHHVCCCRYPLPFFLLLEHYASGSGNCRTCSGTVCGVSVCSQCIDGYYVSNGDCVPCLYGRSYESYF